MSDVNLKTMKQDLTRMEVMLRIFQRIAIHERTWFLARLTADHAALMEEEIKQRRADEYYVKPKNKTPSKKKGGRK